MVTLSPAFGGERGVRRATFRLTGMRKSNLFLLSILIQGFLLLLLFIHAAYTEKTSGPGLEEKRAMVRRLELTDLCLFTEASYTRHLSQADLHTPFQSNPLSLEHFPSGSFLQPPAMLKRTNGKLD